MSAAKVRSGAAVFLIACLSAASAFAYSADVENIPSDRYFEVALNEIRQAKSSIRLVMYLVVLMPNQPGSKARQLLDALAEAKDRGVEVRVVLDRNAAWLEKGNKNLGAYRYLQDQGVEVFYDDEHRLTHAKALVVDAMTVILGSTNWSEAALTRNAEANVLIRSEGLAQEILEGFEPPVPPVLNSGTEKTLPVPWAFLGSPKLFGRMVNGHDERALDLYLFLLKSFDGNGEGRVVLSYPVVAGGIGVESKLRWRYQDYVRRALNRLQDKYRLISFTDEKQNEDLVILLKAVGDPAEPYRPESVGELVKVPAAYWDWGWDRRLAAAGKVMYLLGTRYASVSPMAPVWFRSEEYLAKEHGFSERFIQNGILDLRRRNLIEVEPDRLSPANYKNRKANRYTPNPLYDPQELEKAFQDLERRYGKGKVKRAVGWLHQIYEDSDVRAAERLIVLEEEFGPEVVRKAAEKVGEMSGNNPKKTVGYLIATSQGIGSRSE